MRNHKKPFFLFYLWSFFLWMLFLLTPFLQADDWLNSSPTGIISIKNIPETPVIEAVVNDLSQTELDRAIRLASRYVATAKSSIRYPLILVFPQWYPGPNQQKPSQIYLQMVLNSYNVLPEPTEKGLRLNTLSAGTAAALSRRGDYTSDVWLDSLNKILTHLKEVQVPPSGNLMRLLYHNSDITPSFWRLSEVLVPIPTLQP